MKKQFLITLLPLLLACACKTGKKATTDAVNTAELVKDDEFRKPVADRYLYKELAETIPLDTVYISKDTLNIITRKMIGCETENFKLVWNEDMGHASPPETAVKLFQYADGACRERHKFHLVYNIASLKLKADTVAAHKTTMIRVGGWGKMTSYVHN